MICKKLPLAAVLAFASCMGYSQETNDAVEFAKTITAEDLKMHLSVIASDEYEGRETGKKGQKMAAEYLTKAYTNMGLAPGNKGSFLQEFHLISIGNTGVDLSVGGESLTAFEDFFYFKGLKDQTITGKDIVYAGYGIEDDKYSDYADVDVAGKMVMIYNGEPMKKGKYIITDSDVASDWTFDRTKKMELAKSKGATGLIVVMEDFKKQFGRFKGYIMADRLSTPEQLPQEEFPIFYVDADKAGAFFALDEKAAKKSLKRRAKGKAFSASVACEVNISLGEKKNVLGTENVLAFIEGTDLKEEVLVISSHYDHIGITNGEINNGADDDGSGTVSVLELAEAFSAAKKAGKGPRRSILFMNFTGEEKGLLGSDYYSSNPVFALENTVADLNIDMIGRRDKKHENDPRYVYIIGSDKLSSDLHNWSENANSGNVNIDLDYTYNDPKDPNRFYYRSDHYNFAKHNIPVIFYFTGVHEDYHKPTDTVEKIEFNKMEEIVKLVFHTAWKIANNDTKPVVDKVNDFEAK